MLNLPLSQEPVITSIVSAARKPGRFDVMVGVENIATLSLESIERLELRVGKSVAHMQERIATEATRLATHDTALNMLAFRARSSVELSRALVRKGHERKMVSEVISALEERGLLNDAAFAESYVRSKVVGARHSRRRVQQGLAKKGVARDVSARAVASVFENESVDQSEVVMEVARKKMRSLVRFDPVIRKRKLYGFLARRGYDSDDIRAALQLLREVE